MTVSAKSRIAALLLAALAAPAFAQDAEPERFDFAGGTLTVTETDDFEKILDFDGEELARDYFVAFDRIAEIGNTEVAFFSVGPGGNACAPSTLMVWKTDEGGIESASGGDGCDTPPPALTDYDVFFVPYLMPGASADVRIWNPAEGFRLHGRIAFVPQPDTGWRTFDPDAISHPMDLFGNADIYAAAQALLGDEIGEVSTGLLTAGAPDVTDRGILYARGCVPHACTLSDTFVVVDGNARALYFAQQGEPARFWPDRAGWPQAFLSLVPSDF